MKKKPMKQKKIIKAKQKIKTVSIISFFIILAIFFLITLQAKMEAPTDTSTPRKTYEEPAIKVEVNGNLSTIDELTRTIPNLLFLLTPFLILATVPIILRRRF